MPRCLAALLLVGTLLLSSCGSIQQAPLSEEGFYLPPAGLCDDFPEETATHQKIVQDLQLVKETGAGYFRFGIGWDSIEEGRGKYNWRFWDDLVRTAQREKVTLIPYVAYTPRWLGRNPQNYWREPPMDLLRFGRFMYVIANRYKNEIDHWELWNEPDNKDYWLGDAKQYAQMIRFAAQQVRRANPRATIVLGGMAYGAGPFLETLLLKHHIGDLVDVINFHGYNETWSADPTEQYAERIRQMADLLRRSDARCDLWIAEFGYSDARYRPNLASAWNVPVIYDYEHTSGYQAVVLLKAHFLALASGKLSLTAWYRIHDLPPGESVIGDDNNKHLGLLDVNENPKPALAAFRLFHQLIDQPVRSFSGEVEIRAPKRSQSMVTIFEKENGNIMVAMWLRSSRPDEVADKSGMAQDTRQELISIHFPKQRFQSATIYQVGGGKIIRSVGESGNVLKKIELRGGRIWVVELVKE